MVTLQIMSIKEYSDPCFFKSKASKAVITAAAHTAKMFKIQTPAL